MKKPIKTTCVLSKMIAGEVITIQEAKNYMKLSKDTDDKCLLELITSVREAAESFLNINIIKKEFEQIQYSHQGDEIQLKQLPVVSIKGIFIIDNAGNRKAVASDKYQLSVSRGSLILECFYLSKTIGVNYISGYDNKDLPLSLKTGMLMHLSSIYDQGIFSSGIPPASLSFYNLYREKNIFTY